MENTVKNKQKKVNIPLDELKKMFPVFLLGNGIMLLGLGIFGLFYPIDWRVLTGTLVGNAVSAANFYIMGKSVEATIERRQEKRAKRFATATYSIRYLALLIILAALLWFKLVDIISTLIPLFFPKIAYMLEGMKKPKNPFDED